MNAGGGRSPWRGATGQQSLAFPLWQWVARRVRLYDHHAEFVRDTGGMDYIQPVTVAPVPRSDIAGRCSPASTDVRARPAGPRVPRPPRSDEVPALRRMRPTAPRGGPPPQPR